MGTTNYNLPLIDGTSSAKVPRDLNALAAAVGVALQEQKVNPAHHAERSGILGFVKALEMTRSLKMFFVGDSTSDGPAGSAQFLYEYLNRYTLNSGGSLEGATIIDRGASGNTLQNFLIDVPNTRGISTIIVDAPDLIVFSYGINDVRTGARTKMQLKADLSKVVSRLLNEMKAYILLRIPNSLGADDPNGTNYIQPISNTQLYTDILWESYQEVFKESYFVRLDLLDMQSLVFGRTVQSIVGNPLMGDPLHPTKDGYYKIASIISEYIGKRVPFRADKSSTAKMVNATSPYTVYPKLLDKEKEKYDLVAEGYFVAMGSNYLDFAFNPADAYKIQVGDIIKVGDKLAYDLTAGSASASGTNTRISSEMTFLGVRS